MPKKEDMENIRYADYADYKHGKRVWNEFKIKNLDEYHNLYAQNDTLLLADVFKNFRNKCIEIYEPDSAHFYQHLDLHGKLV